jgi:predicted nucleotidyltransferase
MIDHFDKTIADYLMPMDKLEEEGPSDAIYLLHRKGGLVFCEGYAHMPGGLYGSLIKYPDPTGHIDIFGRKFNWTHRYYIEGNLEIVPYREQVIRQMQVLPELADRPIPPPYAEYFCHFLLDDFKGYFDSRHSLAKLRETSSRLDEVTASIEGLLGVSSDNIGCTGSLAYGYYEEPLEDVDLVFFGTVEENRRIVEKILDLKKQEPEREVFELGKKWPLRFNHMGAIICPFFKYSDASSIPLKNFDMEVIDEYVDVAGTVTGDRHAVYMPVILRLDDVRIGKKPSPPLDLIIYDGAERGEYFNGFRLDVKARLIKINNGGNGREALLTTNPDSVKIAGNGIS